MITFIKVNKRRDYVSVSRLDPWFSFLPSVKSKVIHECFDLAFVGFFLITVGLLSTFFELWMGFIQQALEALERGYHLKVTFRITQKWHNTCLCRWGLFEWISCILVTFWNIHVWSNYWQTGYCFPKNFTCVNNNCSYEFLKWTCCHYHWGTIVNERKNRTCHCSLHFVFAHRICGSTCL